MIRPATPKAVGLVLALITFATACAERGLPTASGPQSRVTANQVSDGPDIEPSAERLAFGEGALGGSRDSERGLGRSGDRCVDCPVG